LTGQKELKERKKEKSRIEVKPLPSHPQQQQTEVTVQRIQSR
jgi:hypothetical protein